MKEPLVVPVSKFEEEMYKEYIKTKNMLNSINNIINKTGDKNEKQSINDSNDDICGM
tara:strand:+ start:318 stop:488 length:171 start_codon:yes stop_codon:yes gene_type:complete